MSNQSHLRLATSNDDHLRPEPTAQVQDVEFITIPEWSRRLGCTADSGYRAARRDEIPGLYRIGRLMRVNWVAFVEATARADGSSPRSG